MHGHSSVCMVYCTPVFVSATARNPPRMILIAGCVMMVAMSSAVINAHEYSMYSVLGFQRHLKEMRTGTVLYARFVYFIIPACVYSASFVK